MEGAALLHCGYSINPPENRERVRGVCDVYGCPSLRAVAVISGFVPSKAYTLVRIYTSVRLHAAMTITKHYRTTTATTTTRTFYKQHRRNGPMNERRCFSFNPTQMSTMNELLAEIEFLR